MTGTADEHMGSTAHLWWRDLQPRENGGGGDPGSLARLRRAGGVRDAAVEPATIALCRALGLGPEALGTVAATATVLAHVRTDRPGLSFARSLGGKVNGRATMSWLRFRRLIQARTEDERMAAFRRAVALSGREANIRDLAIGLLDWTDLRRRRWLYDYHDAPDFAPSTEDQAP